MIMQSKLERAEKEDYPNNFVWYNTLHTAKFIYCTGYVLSDQGIRV
jgi:hypothetical protein